MNNKIEIEVTTQEQKERLITFFQAISYKSLFHESLLEQVKGIEIERKLPKTWEEYLDTLSIVCRTSVESELLSLECFDNFYTCIYKLRKLRDYYNDGWKPDFTYSDDKYVLVLVDDDIGLHLHVSKSEFLVFKTKEIAKQFKDNFEDLIREYYDAM